MNALSLLASPAAWPPLPLGLKSLRLIGFLVLLVPLAPACGFPLASGPTSDEGKDIFFSPSQIFGSNIGGAADAGSEEVADVLRLIRGPMGGEPRYRPKTILILSDTTGLMAKSAVEKSLAQFDGCDDERFFRIQSQSDSDSEFDEESDEDDESCDNMSTKLYPFLKTEEQVAAILKRAEGLNTLVVYTFADPMLREQTRRMCELSKFGHVDLLGPMFEAMSSLLDQQPLGMSQVASMNRTSSAFDSVSRKRKQQRSLSDKYFRRIEAVEYTLKCDDGKNPWDWNEADLLLCGVSRTGKTPLSVVLSHTMGFKVANIPLVVDLDPPAQLYDGTVDPRRVFCLTLSLNDLIRIRRHRLRKKLMNQKAQRGGMARSTYADPDYLKRDLEHARQIATEHGFTEIDVTGRAVEETASYIGALLNQRFPQEP